MTSPNAPLYAYGALAWLWRGLGAVGLVAGVAGLLFACVLGEVWPALVGIAVGAPIVYLFPRVATRLDVETSPSGDVLVCRTLAGTTRRIPVDRLEGFRYSRTAAGRSSGPVYAPSVWVKVRGGAGVYLDLLAEIPDWDVFTRTLRLPLRREPGYPRR